MQPIGRPSLLYFVKGGDLFKGSGLQLAKFGVSLASLSSTLIFLLLIYFFTFSPPVFCVLYPVCKTFPSDTHFIATVYTVYMYLS